MTKETVPEQASGRLNKRLIFPLLGIVIIIRLSLIFILPFGQKTTYHLEGLNDEPAHFNYVRYLAINRSFPVLTHWVLEKDAFVRNEFEYHQAPLYYCLCVPFYMLFGEKGALVPCRLMSAVFGIFCMWLLALIVRDLGYPEKIRAGAALFTGLLFSHLYFSSFVSNDPLSWLLALLLTRELLRYGTNNGKADRKASVSSLIMMLIWSTAGLLTKSSFLVFLPIILGVCIYKYIRSKKTACLAQGLIVLGISGVMALPWYVRNMLLYHSITGMPVPAAPAPFSLSPIIGFMKGTIKYFWFPMQNLEGGTAVFAVLTLCGAALVLFHLVLALYWMVQKRNCNVGTILLAILFIINGGAAFWYYLQWQNPEARFLFPALGPIVFFMIVPAYQVFERLNIGRIFIPYVLLIGSFPYAFLVFAK